MNEYKLYHMKKTKKNWAKIYKLSQLANSEDLIRDRGSIEDLKFSLDIKTIDIVTWYEMKKSKSEFFLITYEKEAVGWLMVSLDNTEFQYNTSPSFIKEFINIKNIFRFQVAFIKEEHRRKGIITKMFGKLIHKYKLNKFVSIDPSSVGVALVVKILQTYDVQAIAFTTTKLGKQTVYGLHPIASLMFCKATNTVDELLEAMTEYTKNNKGVRLI